MNSLNFYHHMSGKNKNFFLPGYSAYTYNMYKDNESVTCVNGEPWFFSAKCFADFIHDMEKHCKWKYSGESDLLLVEYENNELRFDHTMDLKLDMMLKYGIIYSVSSFFQELFSYANEHDIATIRNIELLYGGVQLTIETIKEALPNVIGRGTDIARFYSVRDLSK